MAYGAGKYDALCTEVRETSEAEGAIVIVLDGKFGSGFSVHYAQSVRRGLSEWITQEMSITFVAGQRDAKLPVLTRL